MKYLLISVAVIAAIASATPSGAVNKPKPKPQPYCQLFPWLPECNPGGKPKFTVTAIPMTLCRATTLSNWFAHCMPSIEKH